MISLAVTLLAQTAPVPSSTLEIVLWALVGTSGAKLGPDIAGWIRDYKARKNGDDPQQQLSTLEKAVDIQGRAIEAQMAEGQANAKTMAEAIQRTDRNLENFVVEYRADMKEIRRLLLEDK